MKKWWLIGLVLLTLTGCSAEQAGTNLRGKSISLQPKQDVPESFFPKDIKIVSLGDSLTQGVGDSSDTGGYIPYLTSSLNSLSSINNTEFVNLGKKGLKTSGLLKKLEKPEVQKEIKEADLVIITIGGNDMMDVLKNNFSSLTLDLFVNETIEYEQRLTKIFEKIKTLNEETGIVLIGIYNPFLAWLSDIPEAEEILNQWNITSEKTLKSYDQTLYVEIADIFMNLEDNLLYDDLFHPNDLGYQRISERLFEFLSKGNTLNTLIQSSKKEE
ncbi:GDSL-type esterase/lipase family protein [Bacillus sp. 2205SS5-2]|uniref:GDSL-type esterase/lipase family protein n=1 Tax=Bacillus sp. 2205SS5-2 TaxID=3109031 RepID=UPI0030050571